MGGPSAAAEKAGGTCIVNAALSRKTARRAKKKKRNREPLDVPPGADLERGGHRRFRSLWGNTDRCVLPLALNPLSLP